MKYSIIYADPAWSYQVFKNVPAGRPSAQPYSSMRMVDIFELPVKDIAAKDAVLFMWATSPLLPEALHCIKAWGFEFKCVAFTWVKRNKKSGGWFWGMGWWTRSNPEFCLLGVRGNPKRLKANVHSIVESPIGEHSKKPDEVRDRIVDLCGDLPRIELFARTRSAGWDVFGNEVDGSICLENKYGFSDTEWEEVKKEIKAEDGEFAPPDLGTPNALRRKGNNST